MINSRTTEIREQGGYYVTSAPQDNHGGQPPASHYVFKTIGPILEGQLIPGPYLCNQPIDSIISGVEQALLAEFEAWEAASDEDIWGLDLRAGG